MTRELAMIVAYDQNRAIGNAGQLPWHLPHDLRRFKALTLGHTVVMGRKTFASIGRVLPGRHNWVLSRDPQWQHPGVRVLSNWSQVLASHQQGLLWVIGGGEIYRMAVHDVERIEATEVATRLPQADTWFPTLPESDWTLHARETHAADAQHAYAFDFVSRVRTAKG